MVVIKQIKTFDLPALFTAKPGSVRCSLDNQVVVLHRKGAAIFGLGHDPCQKGLDFVTKRTILDCPKIVDQIAIGSSENALVGGNKAQILELIRDRILTPRNYEGIEFLNYFTKAEWSEVRLKDGPMKTPHCVLATLTSTFQLVIYGQTEQGVQDYQRNWTPLISISKTANIIFQQKWEANAALENEVIEEGLRFEEYKIRVRELTCVDFAWMPCLDSDETEVDKELFLLVAHANGTIGIWWMCTSSENGQFVAELICSKSVFEGEIISAMKVQRLDKNIGVLAVGTNNGGVRVFRIEKRTEEQRNTDEIEIEPSMNKPNYFFKEGMIEIWSKDSLRVESFHCSMLPQEERNILKRISVDFIFLKHPYHLCACNISVFADGLVSQPAQHVKIPEGPIVGLDGYSDELLMSCHESGVLSLVYYGNGVLKYLEGSANSIKDGSKMDLYRYNGFVLSPNKSLAFVGKNLDCFYDHNAERDPSKLLVFSTLPTENAWETVKQYFRLNDCSLARIPDVLLGFRHQLRSRKDLNIDNYLEGPGHLQISPDLLKLYLWTLRAMYIPGEEEARGDIDLRRKIAAVYQRQAEVEDEILQHHYISLLESIDETILPNLSLPEAQSLYLIQQFLNSKPNLRHLSFEPAIIPTEKPKCIICSSESDFVDTIQEDDPLGENSGPKDIEEEVAQRKPNVTGFQWTKQQCGQKHFFPVCILTLLPCDYPYRACDSCRVICRFKPTFGQKTECPLCGDRMIFSDALEDIEEPEDTDSDLDDPPGIRFLGVKAEAGFSP